MRDRLSDPLILNAPVISNKPPYQKPEGSEERHQPRPHSELVVPSTRLIVAVRIGMAGIRHVPFHFVGLQMPINKWLIARNVPGRIGLILNCFERWTGERLERLGFPCRGQTDRH
jgi:hypothetical protein